MKTKGLLVWVAPLLFCIAIWVSCNKNKPGHTGTATIVGEDPRTCACCGGYWIDIDGDANRYHIGTIPGSFRLDTVTVFPLRVTLEWTFSTSPCIGTLVNIVRIGRLGD